MAKPGVVQEVFDYSRGGSKVSALYGGTSESSNDASSYSQSRINELKNQGYVQEGNVLKAPEKEYTSYIDKRGRQYKSYSPHVVFLDENGIIVREELYRPALSERSSTGGWSFYEPGIYEKKEYDYGSGLVSVETRDPNNPNTFMATSQRVEGEIKRGERTSEPLVVSRDRVQRRAEERMAFERRLAGVRLFETGVSGFVGSMAGDVRVFPGSREERAGFLRDPRGFNERRYFESVDRRVEDLKFAGFVSSTDILKGKVIEINKKDMIESSNKSIPKFKSTGFERRVEESVKRQEEFFGSEGFQRIDALANLATFGKGTPLKDRSFIGQTAEITLGIGLKSGIGLGGVAVSTGEKLGAIVEGLFTSPKDVTNELIETAKRFEQGPFSFLPGGTPINPEGAATFINILGGAALAYPLAKGNAPITTESFKIPVSEEAVSSTLSKISSVSKDVVQAKAIVAESQASRGISVKIGDPDFLTLKQLRTKIFEESSLVKLKVLGETPEKPLLRVRFGEDLPESPLVRIRLGVDQPETPIATIRLGLEPTTLSLKQLQSKNFYENYPLIKARVAIKPEIVENPLLTLRYSKARYLSLGELGENIPIARFGFRLGEDIPETPFFRFGAKVSTPDFLSLEQLRTKIFEEKPLARIRLGLEPTTLSLKQLQSKNFYENYPIAKLRFAFRSNVEEDPILTFRYAKPEYLSISDLNQNIPFAKLGFRYDLPYEPYLKDYSAYREVFGSLSRGGLASGLLAQAKKGDEGYFVEGSTLGFDIGSRGIPIASRVGDQILLFKQPALGKISLSEVSDNIAQPLRASTGKVFNEQVLSLSSDELGRIESAVRTSRALGVERGLRVEEFVADIEGLKSPSVATGLVESFVSKEGGVFFGSLTTKELPQGFQTLRPGDIDVIFPRLSVEQIRSRLPRLVEELRRGGEDVMLSPSNDNIIQFVSGEKFLEVKSGINQDVLGLDDVAPVGFLGFRFSNLKGGVVGDTVAFGEARAITIGEQLLRKGAGSLIVSGPGESETLSFSGPGILGKTGNPRGLKDVAGFIQTAEGIAELKGRSFNPFERARSESGKAAIRDYFESFSLEQQRDILGKLKSLTGSDFNIKLEIGSSIFGDLSGFSNVPSSIFSGDFGRYSGFSALSDSFSDVGSSLFGSLSPSESSRISSSSIFKSSSPSISPSPSLFTSPSPSISPSPSPSPPFIPEPPSPPPNRIIPPIFGNNFIKQEVFDVVVRESRPKKRGAKPEEVVVSDSPLPLNAAQNLGDYYTDNTSARSFYLKKRKEKKNVVDEPTFFDKYKYRSVRSRSKLKNVFLVEKEPYLIDTLGERREITAKGLKALEKKRRRERGVMGIGL